MKPVALDRTIVVGPFQCNCRLVACPETGDAFVVDPGDEPERILAEIVKAEKELGHPLQVRALLHTHAHLDHIGGSRGVKEALIQRAGADARGAVAGPIAEIHLHRADEPLYKALLTQGQMFGLKYEEPLPLDRYLEDEDTLKVGTLKLTVLHTPGHSPGGVSLRLHEDSAMGVPETVFSGDTLFQNSVGRTDLWGADQARMFQSIRQRLLTLDDETRVCPGHGPETRIGIERRSNPFLA